MTASPIVERLRRKIDETPDFDPDDFDPKAARRFADWPDGRIGDLLTTPPPPRRWFCTERLLAGRGQLLVAVGGSSKTRALYHLGAGAVLGALPWPWTVETKGPAALFLAEDTAADVHLALHALASTLEPEQREALAEGLRVYPLAGRHPMLLELHGQALKLTRVYDWMMKQLDKLPGVLNVALQGNNVHARIKNADISAEQVADAVRAAGITVHEVQPLEPTLEDVFISLIE